MSSRYRYEGYDFIDLTSLVGTGKYRARVAVVAATDAKTPSQHFIDFEIFGSHREAQRRAFEGARTWIDSQVAEDEGPSTKLSPL